MINLVSEIRPVIYARTAEVLPLKTLCSRAEITVGWWQLQSGDSSSIPNSDKVFVIKHSVREFCLLTQQLKLYLTDWTLFGEVIYSQ